MLFNGLFVSAAFARVVMPENIVKKKSIRKKPNTATSSNLASDCWIVFVFMVEVYLYNFTPVLSPVFSQTDEW